MLRAECTVTKCYRKSRREGALKRISTVIIIGLLSFSMFSIFTLQGKATSAPWWNYGWLARRPIEIESSNTQDLVEYSMLFSITYDSNMRIDFGDLRFIYYDEAPATQNELDFWLQEKVDGASAAVWVRIPIIEAVSTTIIYVYYKNPSATTTSNGKNAFWFFDDFDNEDYVSDGWWAWNYAGTGGQWVEMGTVVTQIGSNLGDTILSCNIPEISSYEMQARAQPEYWTEDAVFVGTGNYSVGPGHGQEMAVGIDWGYLGVPWRYWGITNTTGEGGPIGAWTYIERPINLEWYTFRLVANGTSYGWVSDSTGMYYVGSPKCASPTITGVHFKANPMQKYASYDWIFVRKYAYPEPDYIIGYEEYPPVVNQPPVATFDVNPPSYVVPSKMYVGANLTFSASASYDPDGVIVSYAWDFGDGRVGTEEDNLTYHFYAIAGTYTATLTVTDNDGATASFSLEIYIHPSEWELFIEIDYMDGHEPTPNVLAYIGNYYLDNGIRVTFSIGIEGISDIVPDPTPETPWITDADFWAIEAVFNDVWRYDDRAFGTKPSTGDSRYYLKEKWVLYMSVYGGFFGPNITKCGRTEVPRDWLGRMTPKDSTRGGNYVFIADLACDKRADDAAYMGVTREQMATVVFMHELGHSIGIFLLEPVKVLGLGLNWIEKYDKTDCYSVMAEDATLACRAPIHCSTVYWNQKDMKNYEI